MTKFTDKLNEATNVLAVANIGREHPDLKAIQEARQQILAAVGEAIGPDERPDTERAAGIKNGKRQYEPAYSLRAQFINGERNRVRQALGITKGGADE